MTLPSAEEPSSPPGATPATPDAQRRRRRYGLIAAAAVVALVIAIPFLLPSPDERSGGPDVLLLSPDGPPPTPVDRITLDELLGRSAPEAERAIGWPDRSADREMRAPVIEAFDPADAQQIDTLPAASRIVVAAVYDEDRHTLRLGVVAAGSPDAATARSPERNRQSVFADRLGIVLSTKAFEVTAPEFPVPRDPAAPPVGACGTLARTDTTTENTRFTTAPCESSDANYTIAAVTDLPSQCPKDADQSYYSRGSQGAYTACLDVKWRIGECVADITGIAGPCTPNAANRLVPRSIETFDPARTESPDTPCENGKAYRERGIAVCGDWVR